MIKFLHEEDQVRLLEGALYTMADLDELSTFAQQNHVWRFVFEQVNPTPNLHYGMIAIAAPNGDVAVWTAKLISARSVSIRYCVAVVCQNLAFARYWPDGRASVVEGRKRTRPLAEAAGRVLHARVFGAVVEPRDEYLAEWAMIDSGTRPDTDRLLNASMDALAAASALLVVGEAGRAAELIRTTRCTRPAAPKPRKKRTQISGSMYAALVAGKAES